MVNKKPKKSVWDKRADVWASVIKDAEECTGRFSESSYLYEDDQFVLDKDLSWDRSFRPESHIEGNQMLQGIENPKWLDIKQGGALDCALLAVLGGLEDEHISGCFVKRELLAKGVLVVRLCVEGRFREVVTDTRLPLDEENALVFAKVLQNQVWVAFIEKSIAKVLGGYEKLDYIPMETAISCLFGPVQDDMVCGFEDSFWWTLWNCNKQFAVINSMKELPSKQSYPVPVLREKSRNHCFTILEVTEIRDSKTTQRFVKLRDPCGEKCTPLENWTAPVNPELQLTDVEAENGAFWISVDDLTLYVVNQLTFISEDEIRLKLGAKHTEIVYKKQNTFCMEASFPSSAKKKLRAMEKPQNVTTPTENLKRRVEADENSVPCVRKRRGAYPGVSPLALKLAEVPVVEEIGRKMSNRNCSTEDRSSLKNNDVVPTEARYEGRPCTSRTAKVIQPVIVSDSTYIMDITADETIKLCETPPRSAFKAEALREPLLELGQVRGENDLRIQQDYVRGRNAVILAHDESQVATSNTLLLNETLIPSEPEIEGFGTPTVEGSTVSTTLVEVDKLHNNSVGTRRTSAAGKPLDASSDTLPLDLVSIELHSFTEGGNVMEISSGPQKTVLRKRVRNQTVRQSSGSSSKPSYPRTRFGPAERIKVFDDTVTEYRNPSKKVISVRHETLGNVWGEVVANAENRSTKDAKRLYTVDEVLLSQYVLLGFHKDKYLGEWMQELEVQISQVLEELIPGEFTSEDVKELILSKLNGCDVFRRTTPLKKPYLPFEFNSHKYGFCLGCMQMQPQSEISKHYSEKPLTYKKKKHSRNKTEAQRSRAAKERKYNCVEFSRQTLKFVEQFTAKLVETKYPETPDFESSPLICPWHSCPIIGQKCTDSVSNHSTISNGKNSSSAAQLGDPIPASATEHANLIAGKDHLIKALQAFLKSVREEKDSLKEERDLLAMKVSGLEEQLKRHEQALLLGIKSEKRASPSGKSKQMKVDPVPSIRDGTISRIRVDPDNVLLRRLVQPKANLDSLKPQQWLKGAILDDVVVLHRLLSNAEAGNAIQVFPTHFFEWLKRNDGEFRETKEMRDVLSKRMLIWPMHIANCHWIVGVLFEPSTATPTLLLLDSGRTYDLNRMEHLPALLSWWRGAMRVRTTRESSGRTASIVDEFNVFLPALPDHQQAESSNDCGVFAIHFLRFLLENPGWTPENLHQIPKCDPTSLRDELLKTFNEINNQFKGSNSRKSPRAVAGKP